ncbi:hypothetical protein Btru_071843 [Bulinus truncatus]|nr:hypothetical protein Btru_071843 [Bulinus truncatus]
MVLHGQIILTAFVICFIGMESKRYSIVCDHVQETESGSVQILIRQSEDEPDRTAEAILLKDHTRIVFCKTFKRCQINDQYSEMFHLSENVTDDAHQVNVTMREVLRDGVVSPEGVWTLTYFEQSDEQLVESCYFYVFAISTDVYCSYTMIQRNRILRIVCSASGVYPPMKCFIDDSLAKNKYYLNNITSGGHVLNIVVFPDVTGTSSDVLIGRNLSLTFNIGYDASKNDVHLLVTIYLFATGSGLMLFAVLYHYRYVFCNPLKKYKLIYQENLASSKYPKVIFKFMIYYLSNTIKFAA